MIIYLIENNQLRQLTLEGFKSGGYNFDNVVIISQREFEGY